MALGTVNVPGYIPADFDAVNSKIGDLNNLNTTDKSNLVAAINEVDGDITTAASIASSAQTLANSASSSAASAQTLANTASSSAASAQTLANTASGNASTALTRIGDLSSLNTETKTNLVAALNEIIETGVASGSDPEFTLSAVNAEIKYFRGTAEIICAYKGSGQLLVVSAEPDIISVAIEDQSTSGMNVKKIILTRVGYSQDDTTINIALTSDGEHDAASGTITVAGQTITTLEDTDWGSIQTVGGLGIGANYFDIGDTKTITLNGNIGDYFTASNLQLKVFIIEFNYRGDNGIYFQGFKTLDGVDVALCESNQGKSFTNGVKTFNTSHWGGGNHGGWKGCDLRYDILGSTDKAPSNYGSGVSSGRTGYDATEAAKTSPAAKTLMAALPADLRAGLAPWTVYTDNHGDDTGQVSYVTSSVDYLPLLAEFELAGARTSANQYEQNKQSQMSYYKNGNSKLKKQHNNTTTIVYYFLRSPCGYSYSYHCVYGYNTLNNKEESAGTPPGVSRTLAPAFRVA